MKFFVALLLTALLAYAGGLFFPWWIIAVAAFVVAAFIPLPPYKAFISGFLALFALWGLYTTIIDDANHHVLATRLALVLPLGGSFFALIMLTACIGGLVAGMAALTASYLRKRTPNP